MRVIWELRGDPLSFRALQASCEGMSPSVLNQRLDHFRRMPPQEAGETIVAGTWAGTPGSYGRELAYVAMSRTTGPSQPFSSSISECGTSGSGWIDAPVASVERQNAVAMKCSRAASTTSSRAATMARAMRAA